MENLAAVKLQNMVIAQCVFPVSERSRNGVLCCGEKFVDLSQC